MKDKDVFAGIAAGGVSRRSDRLKETVPAEKPKVYFNRTKSDYKFIKDKDHNEKLMDFSVGIDELKKKFVPFTIRKCGDEITDRTRKYLEDFSFRFEGSDIVEKIKIPHYTGPKGRWTAYYESGFTVEKPAAGRRLFIVFKGVDYYADVYINEEHVCSHEGFFASFEADITDFLESDNSLRVKVGNDIPTIGNGDMQVNGDKLYAATGLGWDDPEEGWHHCPAGGGIFDKVYLEERDELYIDDVFIRPDIDSGSVQVNVSVFSPYEDNTLIGLSADIIPYNFDSAEKTSEMIKVTAGYGLNYYSFTINMNEFRMWDPESPWMYLAMVKAEKDTYESTFGMRKFYMDEEGNPRGSLFLNNKPVLLRGANEMGHLQLCVMREDFDQLIEDVLIARYCNMNYYRITQRPVQEEIYHYCDMLGMLNQADLPLFGYMRKNKFHEGVKQAGEMERLIRNHPSVIMATYINEPFAPEKYGLGYRHMSRNELELFFDACDAAVHFENPDRVIKRVEGDYDPPTKKGMSDFHCYNMWYTNHALPIGMLYRGYLPALNDGWKTGCGEYGTEGLDNYEVMRKYYPKDWLPGNDDDEWIPDKIIRSQTNTMHGDWYEEQSKIMDWIEQSQEHQAFATKLMTTAFRRRSDKIVSTAIHLLIDAWPSGWMKTLLDVDRNPKKAYFTFKESLQPLTVSLRCDRWSGYSLETIDVEAWVLNDCSEQTGEIKMFAKTYFEGRETDSFEMDLNNMPACTSKAIGIIPVEIPKVKKYGRVEIKAAIIKDGLTLSGDSLSIDAWPVQNENIPAYGMGKNALRLIGKTPGITSVDLAYAKAVVVSSADEYNKALVPVGIKKMFILPDENDGCYETDEGTVGFKTIFDPEELGENGELKGLSFVVPSDRIKNVFGKKAFSYWYNEEKDFIDHVAEYYIKGDKLEELVFGYEKPSWGKTTSGKKRHLPVAAKKGNDVFISLETKGRSGKNPALDKLITMLLTEEAD